MDEEKVLKYIQQKGLYTVKTKERAWGGFELLISWNGQDWALCNRAFGKAYDPLSAAAMFIYDELTRSPPDPMFMAWFGEERYKELTAIKLLTK